MIAFPVLLARPPAFGGGVGAGAQPLVDSSICIYGNVGTRRRWKRDLRHDLNPPPKIQPHATTVIVCEDQHLYGGTH